MLLDHASLDLAPHAPEVVAELADARVKAELPAAQLELISPPAANVTDAARQLGALRRDTAAATDGRFRLAAAGTHPFTAQEGVVNPDARYTPTVNRYGLVARRQLVFGLHVHVALPGAERALAVYNALRSHLPELAALGANAPLVAGRDSGLASIRPTIAVQLPRQGVPPAIESWEAHARDLAWAVAADTIDDARQWWWELRPHPQLGTVEVRVPDAQTELWQAAAIGAVVQSLVASIAARQDAGEHLPTAPSWRIAENRWSACRFGLEGRMADLGTGHTEPTRERVTRLLADLEPVAARLGATTQLRDALALARANGAERQRAIMRERGPEGAVAWLAECFAPNAEAPPAG